MSSPSRIRSTLLVAGALAAFSAPLLETVQAHEPIFGVGPRTLFDGGLALEAEAEFGDDGLTNTYELAYGITPDLTATAALPVSLTPDLEVTGAGLRVKWRFLRRDAPGASDSVAVAVGFEQRRAAASRALATVALTYGHEGRRWYWWADLRYRADPTGSRTDDLLLYDLAFGVRPWLLRYEQPDLVLLWELNGRRVGAAASATGQITTGPALFFTYRNYALKGGLVLPTEGSVRSRLGGLVALEGHF